MFALCRSPLYLGNALICHAPEIYFIGLPLVVRGKSHAWAMGARDLMT
jgi:hypothetical protein